MLFKDKLVFLMQITNLSNKELAETIHVAPTMISLLRTGRREMPKNREHIRNMASCFSEHCVSDYQLQGLADAIGLDSIRFISSQDDLYQLIYTWLAGEDLSQLQAFRLLQLLNASPQPPSPQDINATSLQSHKLFYGTAGKMDAFQVFHDYLLQMDAPATIYVSSDENSDWSLSNPANLKMLQHWQETIMKKGFQYVRIFPNISGSGQIFESLIHQLPLMMSGQAEIYYYPRFRDNLYRCSVTVLPGHICMASFSLAMHVESVFTVISTDATFINAHVLFFQQMLQMCEPALLACDWEHAYPAALQLLYGANQMHTRKCFSLSPETLPDSLVQHYYEKDPLKEDASVFFNALWRNRLLLNSNCIDICHLATVEQVQNGIVPIVSPAITSDSPEYYTPRLYAEHLKQIIALLQECPTYHCIMLPFDASVRDAILMSDNHIMISRFYPFMLYEVQHPTMQHVLREYLLQIRETHPFRGIHRQHLISELTAMIESLES